jgi:hypothetical protein
VIPALFGAGLLMASAGPMWPIELQSLGQVVHQQSARLKKPNLPVKEYVEGRKTLRADLNGDHRDDLAILFTLERGDLWIQYLTVISSAGKPLATAEVGRKGVRAVDLDHGVSSMVELSTKTYRPEDASCCPSVLGRTVYRLKGHGLSEIKPPAGVAANGPPPLRHARRRHR